MASFLIGRDSKLNWSNWVQIGFGIISSSSILESCEVKLSTFTVRGQCQPQIGWSILAMNFIDPNPSWLWWPQFLRGKIQKLNKTDTKIVLDFFFNAAGQWLNNDVVPPGIIRQRRVKINTFTKFENSWSRWYDCIMLGKYNVYVSKNGST